MLQIRNSETISNLNGARSTALSPGDLVASLKGLARRRFGILVLIFTLSVIFGAIYLYVTPPKFLAQASILIDSRKTQLFSQQSASSDAAPVDSATVESQIEVLKSQDVAA